MSTTRSRVPLERDKNGARILTHGESGYKRGCGCPPCLKGHAEAEREHRADRSGRTPASARRAARQTGKPGGMPPQARQETGVASLLSRREAAAFTAYLAVLRDTEGGYIRDLILEATGRGSAARSSEATAAAKRQPAAGRQDTHGGMTPRDKRTVKVASRLAGHEAAAFAEYLERLGGSVSAAIRDLILDAIGYEDATRRQARRRPNRSRHSQRATATAAEQAGGEDGDDLWERLGDDAEDAKEGQ